MATVATGTATPPWVYFLAGTIVPSLAWLLLRPKASSHANDDDDDEEDEDTIGTTTGGPSSKWGYSNAPYKVSRRRWMILVYCIRLWPLV